MNPLRRVVSGLKANGRSGIVIDGPAKRVIWSTERWPADNSGNDDAGGETFSFPTHGAKFMVSDAPPGRTTPMHASSTIDYIAILSGEIVFVTETEETVLRAGDVLIIRGVRHCWRNDSDAPCRSVVVLCPAEPLELSGS